MKSINARSLGVTCLPDGHSRRKAFCSIAYASRTVTNLPASRALRTANSDKRDAQAFEGEAQARLIGIARHLGRQLLIWFVGFTPQCQFCSLPVLGIRNGMQACEESSLECMGLPWRAK
jgi:hypothetical protein